MSKYYKAIDADRIPADLTKPTGAYKRHVWLSVLGLIVFMLFYFGLTWWFVMSAVRCVQYLFFNGGDNIILYGIAGFGMIFLSIFMIKSLFFSIRYDNDDSVQIFEKDEPELFAFIHAVADEAKAPRPAKVYLTSDVNASVFYDLSLFNLFFPSRKNLNIGLGLVNVLSLGEFKAVLAHEFGHFAQRSMLLGRWVYIANQVVYGIVYKRDVFDSLLSGLSRFDIRIAWIGWILSIIVWAIRAVVDTLFKVLLLVRRALSREMEFQADLVAVSLTGSDAIVNALHRLGVADEAYNRGIQAAQYQLANKKAVPNFYSLQSNAIKNIALILDDETYGQSPVIPDRRPEEFRVFKSKIAHPPKMWSTHPPDIEREANAKERYIAAEIDPQSSWVLFADPLAVQKQMTEQLIKQTGAEGVSLMSDQEALSDQNKGFARTYYDPKYKGMYLGRFFLSAHENVDDFLKSSKSTYNDQVGINELYPDNIKQEIEVFTELNEEIVLLEGIQSGNLKSTTKNQILHRGEEVKRSELPTVISSVKEELQQSKVGLSQYDSNARGYHYSLAQKRSVEWGAYYKSLLDVLHYSEHQFRNIQDQYGIVQYELAIVLADNKVTQDELYKLVSVGNDLYYLIKRVHEQKNEVQLDSSILSRLDNKESWAANLEEFTLVEASTENAQQWYEVIDGWTSAILGSLEELRSTTLGVLLRFEDELRADRDNLKSLPLAVPTLCSVPSEYPLLLEGQERESQSKLSIWERFQIADGLFPTIARLGVAFAIVAAVVILFVSTNSSTLHVFNGLDTTVIVQVNEQQLVLDHFEHRSIDFKGSASIVTKTEDGRLIEQFEESVSGRNSNAIYNVASAASLYEYRMFYGRDPVAYDNNLGIERWITERSDYYFEEPPETISTSSDSETRDVIDYVESPSDILSYLENIEDIRAVISTHILYDKIDGDNYIEWLNFAAYLENGEEVISQRQEENPRSVELFRARMNIADSIQYDEVCKEINAIYAMDESSGDFFYLKSRCIKDESAKDAAFAQGVKKWPNNVWLNYAASYTEAQKGNWKTFEKYVGKFMFESPALFQDIEEDYYLYSTSSFAKNYRSRADHKSIRVKVQQMLDKESADLEQTFYESFLTLQKGDLDNAIREANLMDAYISTITVLAACSNTATDDHVDQVFSSTDFENTSNEILLYAFALAHQKKNDKAKTKFKQQLEERFNQNSFELLSSLIEYLDSKSFMDFESKVNELRLNSKGVYYMFARIYIDDDVPQKWKTFSTDFTFFDEQPYFE